MPKNTSSGEGTNSLRNRLCGAAAGTVPTMGSCYSDRTAIPGDERMPPARGCRRTRRAARVPIACETGCVVPLLERCLPWDPAIPIGPQSLGMSECRQQEDAEEHVERRGYQ